MKKSMLALLLALCLLLTGCGEVKKAEKALEEINDRYSALVATYDGGEVTAGDVMGEFHSLYSLYYNYLNMLGYVMSSEEAYSIMDTALTEHVRMEVAAAHFDAEYNLTAEEISAVEEEVQAEYAEIHAQALLEAEGKSEEEKEIRAQVLLRQIGSDLESLSANALMWKKAERMEEILGAEIAELSEEELLAAYEERVSSYETAVSEGEVHVENDMTDPDSIAYWMPEGYRRVKHILLMPSDDAKLDYLDAEYAVTKAQERLAVLEEELADIQDYDGEAPLERGEEQVQADIQAAEAELARVQAVFEGTKDVFLAENQEKIDEIYARLAAGEDFETLIAEFGEDPGMRNAPTNSRGYYVSSQSKTWEKNFRDGAMMLAQPGDYSAEPIVGGSGVHIIYYIEDVPAGAANYEDVRDILRAETMEAARQEHCDATIDAWVAELNPQYDREAFSAVFFED